MDMVKNERWWARSCVYQIYPKSFMDSNGDGIGDIRGIISRLDYLKSLGVDVLWVNPIYRSPNADNGYDISDYRSIQPEFGTMEDFEELLEKAHSMGLHIVLDLVVNHSSDEHSLFVESRKSRDNPYRDYYIWRDPVDGREPNNWGSCFAGSAWKYDELTGQYYLHLFAEKQPDFNWDNPHVRFRVYDMMKWWLDKGIDGFRMDVISLISKDPSFPDGIPGANGYASFNAPSGGPHVHEYLREMRKEVLSKYDILTVGECSGVTIEEAPDYASLSGDELDMVFHFDHMGLDDDPVTGSKWCVRKMDIVRLKQILSDWEVQLHGKAWNSLFWDNHDQPRVVSRLGSEGDLREKSAKMLATCLHMMEGTPYIFQGEELGMTNMPWQDESQFRDIDAINGLHEILEQNLMGTQEAWEAVCYKSRDNARTPMQWDDSSCGGFTSGKPWIDVNPNYRQINVKEQSGRADSVLNYYRKLIALRKKMDLIVYGSYRLLEKEDPDLFVFRRDYQDESLLCICNFHEVSRQVQIPEEFQDSRVLISNCGAEDKPGDVFKAGPYDAVVFYHSSMPEDAGSRT